MKLFLVIGGLPPVTIMFSYLLMYNNYGWSSIDFILSRWRVFWSVKFNQIGIDYQFYPLPIWIEYKYCYVLVLLLLRINLFCLVEMVLFSSLLDKLSPWLEGGIKLWLVFVRSLHEDQVLSSGSCFRVQVKIQKIRSYHKGQCSDKIQSLALSKFFTVLNPNNWRRSQDRRWLEV